MSNIIKKSDTYIPKFKQYKPEKDHGFTLVSISVIIFIVGMMISLYFATFTYIELIQVFELYAVFIIIALLIPKKFIYKIKLIHYERIIIAFTGFPMFFITMFFVLNYYIIVDEYEREYEVSNIYFSKNQKGAIFTLKNPDKYLWGDAPFKINELRSAKPTKAVLTIGKGIFGYEVEKKLVLE
jgi:hypothetical protein